MLKVLTIVGTRPEMIRLAAVIKRLDRVCEHVLVHTGQNYDYELNEVFFHDLDLREPDYFLNTDTSSLGAMMGDILRETEKVLRKERPDAALILGDTNSAIAGVIIKRMKVPLYHMEAGNRSFDFNVPEEINRRMIDHISDFNLVYTEHARRHLISEGLPQRRIYLTGSPMREVLDAYREKIEASAVLDTLELKPREYVLASLHREENVDNKANLRRMISILGRVSEEFACRVVVSTHPRTRQRLEALGDEQAFPSRVEFMKPWSFSDYNRLQMDALCVISDSGTVSEESAILGFPAITMRNAMERPEALDTGSILLSGMDPDIVLTAMKQSIEGCKPDREIPVDYQVTNTSERVVNLILGTSKLSNRWWGIEKHDYN